jgi:glycosidase
MAVPGIPCIYYGSEWGIKGEKIQGVTDAPLRPELDAPAPNDLSDLVKKEEERVLTIPDNNNQEEDLSSEELFNDLITKEEPKKEESVQEANVEESSTGPKFCPNCGAPANGGNFCTNCGNKLR